MNYKDYRLQNGTPVGIRQTGNVKENRWALKNIATFATITTPKVPVQQGEKARENAQKLLNAAVKSQKGMFKGAIDSETANAMEDAKRAATETAAPTKNKTAKKGGVPAKPDAQKTTRKK